MTTVTLSDLLDARNESIYVRPRAGFRAHARRAYVFLRRPRFAWLAPLVSLLVGFVARHALVLFGCAAVVTSACMVSIKLGWLIAGLAFFFLEARRR